MLGLLDRIEKIDAGADQQCRIAKKNIFSSVEDEILRLRGLKLHAWTVQENLQPPLSQRRNLVLSGRSTQVRDWLDV